MICLTFHMFKGVIRKKKKWKIGKEKRQEKKRNNGDARNLLHILE